MEKLFFMVVRWIMLVTSAMVFLFLIGGGVYAIKLYQDSKDIEVNKQINYQEKKPNVDFSSFEALHNESLKRKEKQRKKIENYVKKVIKNGSLGHGFAMGSMPANIIKDVNETEEIARFVSQRMQGKKPKSFAACAACHGEDGKGENGQAPDLIKLPIYNGLVSATGGSNVIYAPKESHHNNKKTGENPLRRYASKLTSLINKYAISVGQKGVAVDDMYAWLYKRQRSYREENFLLFSTQLEEGINELLSYAEKLKSSNRNLSDAINWETYMEWFDENFTSQINKERQKYLQAQNQAERMMQAKLHKAEKAESELRWMLIYLSGALGAFILLTMILVLFQIEINTRKDEYEG